MKGRRREPDRIELGGRSTAPTGLPVSQPANGPRRPFLSVWYRCCHTYGRLTRSADDTRYSGACPRCGARVEAMIGPGGTTRRIFEAR